MSCCCSMQTEATRERSWRRTALPWLKMNDDGATLQEAAGSVDGRGMVAGAWRSKGEAERFLRGVRWRKGGVGIDGDGGGAWGATPLLRWR